MSRRSHPKNTDTKHSSTDDQSLFRTAMHDVAPIATPDRVIFKQNKPEPKPRHKNHDDLMTSNDLSSYGTELEINADEDWSFLRPSVSRRTLKQLRQGYWGIQDSLDLHGLTQDAAKQQLTPFLNNAIENSYRCVHIIHGKGLSSKDRTPVLKLRIGNWLAQHAAVLAFCQAKPKDGGSGAVLVLLKQIK